MEKLLFLLSVLTFALPMIALAEDDEDTGNGEDVVVGFEVEAEHKLSKKWSVGAEMELRTHDWLSEYDRFTFGLNAEYKIAKWLKASAGGTYMAVNNETKTNYRSDGSVKWIRDAYVSPRYRVFAALTGKLAVGRFGISLRERWQFTYRPPYDYTRMTYTRDGAENGEEEAMRSSKHYNVLRSRLAVDYDIRNCPVTPFVSAEMYNGLNHNFRVEKWRYAVGADWKVTKKHILSLTYKYEDLQGTDDETDTNAHYITLGYKLKF